MKRLKISISLFAAILCLSSTSKSAITNVYIEPDVPSTLDDITIFVTGFEVEGPVSIYDNNFFINDTSLTLDLYINTGFFQVITPWDYSEPIGSLPAGSYDLNVNEFLTGNLIQTYPLSFEVIPEPSSIIIFITAAICFMKYKRKRD